ncbi:MAG: insulinase family protein [Armatimonadetes bacterium]|nr:insulinase family protein [Armatimonadota bacterium]MDE2207062.1 insulinase family protein [Armatimonadota bacterium]
MSTEFHVEDVRVTTLSNGLRVVSESVPYVRSAAVGLWAGAGSRDETPRNRGISHFIEHMLFKGTSQRTAREIASEIESRGGHLNAFTGKESTCYHARILADDCETAVDVLTDMLCNSLFMEEEIEREKGVVISEIKMYEDSPDDLVHDVFESTLWHGHPLGAPVIGSEKTVGGFTRTAITGYIAERYRPDRIILSAAGLVDHDRLVSQAERALGSLSGEVKARAAEPPTPTTKRKQIHKRDVEQVSFCLGTGAYSKFDREKYSLSILNDALGGNMSSRLFSEIREKRGLAYAIGSYARTYKEGGLFCVYGGTKPEALDQVIELTRAEFAQVRSEGLTEEEIVKGKRQVRGELVLGLESMAARMARYGEHLLTFGRVIPLNEILAEYDRVSGATIAEVADKVLDLDKLALATVGPYGKYGQAA